MKPKVTTIPERPHPPRMRKAPDAVTRKHDIEPEAPPPRKRRLSKALVLSIVAHVVVLLGASYWVVARHTDAPAAEAGGGEAAEVAPFPLMQRAAPESAVNTSPVQESAPLALRPLPEPELPQPALEEFAANHAILPVEPLAPMFVETQAETSRARDASASTADKRVAVHMRVKPNGGTPKTSKGTAKSSGGKSASGSSGGGVFGIGQLDGKPRLLHHPSAVFPAELARQGASSGTVVLDVLLGEDGSVHVLGTVSASHPALIAEAKRVAAGSEFTPPTHAGQHVKAHMKWPIIIRR